MALIIILAVVLIVGQLIYGDPAKYTVERQKENLRYDAEKKRARAARKEARRSRRASRRSS